MLNISKNDFEQFLIQKRKLSQSSVSKYSTQAHNKILKDLGISFYEVNNFDELHQLFLDVKEMEKRMEKDPRRMYSSAVSNFIKFCAFSEEQKNLPEDTTYVNNVEQQFAFIGKADLSEIVAKYSTVQPLIKLINTVKNVYYRNSQIGMTAIVYHQFKCQINPKHTFFISRYTHKNYVEAHHIIPISNQPLYNYGIDVLPNIACLCPVCHKQVHYGITEQRNEIIKKLYTQNVSMLEKVGLEIKLSELQEMY